MKGMKIKRIRTTPTIPTDQELEVLLTAFSKVSLAMWPAKSFQVFQDADEQTAHANYVFSLASLCLDYSQASIREFLGIITS
jgi:hypothetical protein